MNKTKKLLSVVLAVIMALSCMSVTAFAEKAKYKSVDELTALDAYSPYGQVTRLSTEERMSMVLDFLDMTLAPLTSLNMGTLVDTMGITVTINLTSVDGICDSLDSFKESMSSTAWGLASTFVNLGVLEQLSFDAWELGMSRDGTAQLTIIEKLLDVLSDNAGTIANIVKTGNLDLGLVSSIANINLDLSIIADIPGLIKPMIYGLFERWDDTFAEIKTLDTNSAGNAGVESTINTFVKSLFKNDMSITTVKYDKDGNMTSEHTKMPIYTKAPGTPTDNSPRCYYLQNSNTLKIYHIVDKAEAKASGKTAYTYVEQEETYYLEQEVEGSETYVWKSTDEFGNVTTLKWYNDNSPLIPTLKPETVDSKIDLSSDDISAGDLLYTFMPYLFEDLALVVVNGSVKKILAEFFGAKFNHIGTAGPEGDAEIKALGTDDIFVGEQGDYVFEWSDYYVAADGTHYYRYLDDLYKADLSRTNNYFDIINWKYEITKEFITEFIPANDDDVNNRLVLKLNDFLVKLANTITVESVLTVDEVTGEEAQWTRPTFAAGNANLVANIKAAAQTVIKLAPQHIFGSNYENNPRCYYDMLVSTDNDTVLAGIAATLVDALMPSMTLPTAEQLMEANAKVGAVLAAVIREFAAYLIPEYNFDALIYEDFGTTTADPVKTFLSGKDSNYWLDVILTMGINIGYEYLRAFADMGEGSEQWNKFVTYSGYGVDGKTYAAMTGDELRAHWEGMLDYVVDWALDKDYEWSWKMENLVEVDGLTIDPATAQDPWAKLDKILFGIIPFDEILTITPTTDYPTKLEKFLRYDLILGLVDLRWNDLINTVQFNGANKYFRTGNVLDQLAKLIKNIVNGLFDKVGGGSYALLPSGMTDLDTLANQDNLATLIQGLLGALPTAFDSGLLDTVLPIVNMFLGWSTDAQKYADPVIYLANPNNLPYLYSSDGSTVSTTLKVANNSAGMLETHRDFDNVKDSPYVLTIKSVTCDDSNISATTTLPVTLQPYGTADIAISGAYTSDKVVKFTIVYTFTGKDGKAIGGEQTMQIYMYISNKTDYNYEVAAHAEGYQVNNTAISKVDAVRIQREAFNAIKYGSDPKAIIDNFTIKFTNTSKRDYSQWVYSNTISNNPTYVTANQTWVHGCNENPTLKENKKGWVDGDNTENVLNPLTWVAGTDTSAMVTGSVSALGSLATVWHNHKKGSSGGVKDGGDVKVTINTPDLGQIRLVNTGALASKADSYADVMQEDYDLTTSEAQAAWNAFDAALRNAYTTAKMPYSMSDAAAFTAAFSQDAQDALAKTLDDAYEALKEYVKASGSSAEAANIKTLEDYLATDDNDGEKEVNFQDYQYYEYFNYADLRTEGRNIVKGYYAPEIMDTYYIKGSGIREAELNAVIEAEDNEFIAAGITASRLENDANLVAASVAAHNDFVTPVYSDLFMDDFVARLIYYKQFLTGHEEAADHKQFLDLEIAHVKAQGFVEADYEAVSWARYADALAEAEAVAAGTDEYASFNSRIYDVKYNLMVARKQLLKKADSLIEAGGTSVLKTNIDTADAIFASLAAGDGAWAVKEGVDADAAYAQLISALGYYYVGEDGITYNLYADSALEYRDNDRPNNQGNQAKVNAANKALEDAIANFEAAAADPELVLTDKGLENAAVISATQCTGDGFTGSLFGVETLGFGYNEKMTLEQAYETDAGYIKVDTTNSNGKETTGAVVKLYTDKDELVGTYVFVYFGDVNKDGDITLSDATLISEYYGWAADIDSEAGIMAADPNGDKDVTLSDATLISEYYGWVADMPEQADLAKTYA